HLALHSSPTRRSSDLAFAGFSPHRRLALRFHDIIETRPNCLAPQQADVERLLAFGHELIEGLPAHLLVHCHAGVSRSTASAALRSEEHTSELQSLAYL